MKQSSHVQLIVMALTLIVLPPPGYTVEPDYFEARNNADLMAVCATQPADPDYVAAIHFCHGLGVGFVRYHEALQEGKDFKPVFCLPKSLTRTQALQSYLGYSRAHPEYDRDAVGDVLIKFLSETYPCTQEGAAVTR